MWALESPKSRNGFRYRARVYREYQQQQHSICEGNPEQAHLSTIEQQGVLVSQVYDAPNVGGEPYLMRG